MFFFVCVYIFFITLTLISTYIKINRTETKCVCVCVYVFWISILDEHSTLIKKLVYHFLVQKLNSFIQNFFLNLSNNCFLLLLRLFEKRGTNLMQITTNIDKICFRWGFRWNFEKKKNSIFFFFFEQKNQFLQMFPWNCSGENQ